MTDSFIEKRKGSWRHLETLLEEARGMRGISKLSRKQVRELGRSYRRTAADLAIARVESRDQRLCNYLNNLVIRAHGLVYQAEAHGVQRIWLFYRNEFPVIFRQTILYTLAVFLMFVVISLFAFVATWQNDDFAEFAYLNSQAVQDVKDGHKWWEVLNEGAPTGAAAIIANNIGVALRTFALSIVPVLGTFQALLPTSLQFGAINALAAKYGMTLKLLSFVAGHGVLEFIAIFIAGGAGLLLGLSILVPGERTRLEALVLSGSLAIKLLAGCIPILVIAGCIEGFLSPTTLHSGYKFGISVITAICIGIYLGKSNNQKLIRNW
jgi:uncharacterized membrane protein SpoIIM required for sporulation